MNARQQRLNELIAARDRIDAEIARLDPRAKRPEAGPGWQVQAHQTLLEMPSHGHIRHNTRRAAV